MNQCDTKFGTGDYMHFTVGDLRKLVGDLSHLDSSTEISFIFATVNSTGEAEYATSVEWDVQNAEVGEIFITINGE